MHPPRPATSPARPRDPLALAAKALLDRLAAWPRGTGSTSERRAREACAARLATAGFTVREAPFRYSSFPGRWATPLAGLLLLGTVAGTGHLGYHGSPRLAVACMALGLATIGVFAWSSATWGVLHAPLMRRIGVNLVATRGVGRPPVWLVAHLDSKSQPIPIGVRAAAIVLGGLACVVLLALALGRAAGAGWAAHVGGGAWIAATIAGALAALPVVATTVGDGSPGALDNASGVVSVVLAAESMPSNAAVGVLLTSAEELGLAGARAWVRSAQRADTLAWRMVGPPPVAINCDGVDDLGRLTVMRGRRGKALAAALERAARAEGVHPRIRGLIPGVLVDAVAFVEGGWEAVTVSRGTMATLLRIHRPSDTAERLSGEGMAEAARVMARAATMLVERR